MKLLALAVLSVTTAAAADPQTADRESSEADKLAAAGQLSQAAAKYRSAYAQDPRPTLICNAGVAYYKARELPRAHYYLGRCLALRDKLDAPFVAMLTKAIAAVTAKLEAEHTPRIELSPDAANATIAITGPTSPFDEPVGAGIVWVPPGHYELRFEAQDRDSVNLVVDIKRDQTIVENVALPVVGSRTGESTGIDVTGDGQHGPPPPPPPVTSIETKPIDTKPIAIDHGPPRQPRSKLPAIISTAATGALAIGAIATYVIARGHASDAGAATTQPAYDAARDSAVTYQHASWVLGGLAGAGAVVSGLLWYRVIVAPTPDGATVSVAGRF